MSGGENIASSEVERVLYEHEAVLEVAVVAKPDERWGEVPVAFVALREGATVTADELLERCRAQLAKFKVPKDVTFIDSLPAQPVGQGPQARAPSLTMIEPHPRRDVSDWKTIDYFFDETLVEDPYSYYDDLRSECPVVSLSHLGVVAVTGYDEAIEVYRDPESFSSCNSVIGPFATFPVPLEGDDVSEIVAKYRDQLPMAEHMVTMDPPEHTREHALLMRLITPKRLKDNEDFMWRLADHQLDEFVGAGSCEFISAYAQPFAMLVVADLLGVPEEDHQRFRQGFGMSGTVGEVGMGEDGSPGHNPLAWLDEWFATYIEDRRREPRKDVLTDLALATYPDGSTPDVTAVVRTPPSSSPPGRRPRRACWPPRSSTWPSTPSCRTSSATTARRSPTSSRRSSASRAR